MEDNLTSAKSLPCTTNGSGVDLVNKIHQTTNPSLPHRKIFYRVKGRQGAPKIEFAVYSWGTRNFTVPGRLGKISWRLSRALTHPTASCEAPDQKMIQLEIWTISYQDPNLGEHIF